MAVRPNLWMRVNEHMREAIADAGKPPLEDLANNAPSVSSNNRVYIDAYFTKYTPVEVGTNPSQYFSSLGIGNTRIKIIDDSSKVFPYLDVLRKYRG